MIIVVSKIETHFYVCVFILCVCVRMEVEKQNSSVEEMREDCLLFAVAVMWN